MFNELLADAFFELRTVKGYRYLDDAGEIMNQWDSHFPEKGVGVDGLLMRNMDALFRQLRVDMKTMWLNLHIPDNLDQVVDLSVTTTSKISAIIGVEQYRRVGLRLNYIYSVPSVERAASQIVNNLFSERWFPAGERNDLSTRGFEFMVPTVVAEGIQANTRVSVVKRDPKSKPRKSLPTTGVLVDVDLFRAQITDIRDLKGILAKMQNWVMVRYPCIRDDILKGVDIESNV